MVCAGAARPLMAEYSERTGAVIWQRVMLASQRDLGDGPPGTEGGPADLTRGDRAAEERIQAHQLMLRVVLSSRGTR